ncbi:hypothetical protein BC938DRAFT_480722 [Jimgerdemannia flammicorona]|uniref:Uncharacterized protein n=1 Tax=Jimgerdemannia flammicorona TaxID=994334 RepID=A0A433QHW3_9FUNG|nr:hypothetical protein BC938DRAFT_480722 [Jimgerdemannia flammicorona]
MRPPSGFLSHQVSRDVHTKYSDPKYSRASIVVENWADEGHQFNQVDTLEPFKLVLDEIHLNNSSLFDRSIFHDPSMIRDDP